MFNLPNLISLWRFSMMPVLLVLAWQGYPRVFLVLLATCFFSDVLDGWIARHYNRQTELGARLDSWSDFFNYGTMALGGWWLWPHIFLQERVSVVLIVLSVSVPTFVGLIKFRAIPGYHTWAAKLAALSVGGSGMLLFAGGPAWLFHLSIPLCLYAAAEEILISLILPRPQTNIPTFYHASKLIEQAISNGK